MAEASDFSSPSVNGVTEADKIERRYVTYRGWNQKELALKLAISGFLYTGNGDRVKCETCGLQVEKWLPSYDAIETHRKHSPNCSYINKWFGGKNQTTPENVEPKVPPKYPSYENYQTRLDSYFGWPLKYAHQSPSSMAAEGFFYLGSADRVRCFQCGITLRDWDKDDFPLEAHVTWSPDCQFARQRQKQARCRVTSSNDERNPGSNTMSNPAEENKIKEWRSVRTTENTFDALCNGGNTNTNQSCMEVRRDTGVTNNKTHTEGAVGGVGNQTTSEAGRSKAVSLIRPKYPSYENYQTRLDSYFGWPLKYKHQSPPSMAAEGFFYLGSADRARCFQCGVTLRDWDEDDRPLDAHVTWCPDCQFARQRLKQARRGVSSNSDERNPESNTLSNPTEENKIKEQRSVRTSEDAIAKTTTDAEAALHVISNGGNTTRNDSSVEVRSITDVSNDDTDPEGAVGGVCSTMIDAVLEFGCSIESVRKAIQLERQRNGRDFPDAESLFKAVLDIEESDTY